MTTVMFLLFIVKLSVIVYRRATLRNREELFYEENILLFVICMLLSVNASALQMSLVQQGTDNERNLK